MHQIILTVKMSALVFSRIEQVSTWAILVPNDLEEMRTEINTVYIYVLEMLKLISVFFFRGRSERPVHILCNDG